MDPNKVKSEILFNYRACEFAYLSEHDSKEQQEEIEKVLEKYYELCITDDPDIISQAYQKEKQYKTELDEITLKYDV